MTNTLIGEHLAEVSLDGKTSTNTMQETCWLPSSILHSTKLCTVGATIDTEASAEVQFAKELECGSVKCGSTNTSWSSFVPRV